MPHPFFPSAGVGFVQNNRTKKIMDQSEECALYKLKKKNLLLCMMDTILQPVYGEKKKTAQSVSQRILGTVSQPPLIYWLSFFLNCEPG